MMHIENKTETSDREQIDLAAETLAQILIQQALSKKNAKQNESSKLAGNLQVFQSKQVQ